MAGPVIIQASDRCRRRAVIGLLQRSGGDIELAVQDRLGRCWARVPNARPTQELRAECRGMKPCTLACAYPRADSCRIILVDDAVMKARGRTTELLRRHEIGHCSGW